MPTYQWAINNGEIRMADYTRDMTLSTEQLEKELKDALGQFGASVSIAPISDQLKEVYRVQYSNVGEDGRVFYTSIKGTTPGGRDNLKNEQRIQQKAKYFNYIFDRRQEHKTAVCLGVYKYQTATIFCAWNAVSSTADAETPISKQIKITVIAEALKHGFVQQMTGSGDYVCAFRKEFIYFYLQNSSWLHKEKVSALTSHNETKPIADSWTFTTDYSCKYSWNRIVFGAPGTGKSFTVEKDRKDLLKNGGEYERVTFHPDYSYAAFVGTYKPVPTEVEGKEVITYKYVPGPFMRLLAKALKNTKEDTVKPHVLIIEEINRANVAAVFGEVFQLLDRDGNGVSEYPVSVGKDIREYLAKELDDSPEKFEQIKIPNNLFIWATMNSADQGVFPLDTAFKRRWDFMYLGIDSSDALIQRKTVVLGKGTYLRKIDWNELRKKINDKLSGLKINEDKLLGPFFMGKQAVPLTGEIDRDVFISTFKNKVLMYLFDDAAKQRRASLFAEGIDSTRYSSICQAFDEKGVFVFSSEISSAFDGAENAVIEEGIET